MKLSIVREDGAVYKDGVSFSTLDLSFIPSNIHALQFNDVINSGWLEFNEDDYGLKPANEIVQTLPDWATQALVKWDEAKILSEQIIIPVTVIADNQPITSGTQTL